MVHHVTALHLISDFNTTYYNIIHLTPHFFAYFAAKLRVRLVLKPSAFRPIHLGVARLAEVLS